MRGTGRWYPSRDALQPSSLGVGDEPVAVHRGAICGSEIAEPLSVCGTARNLGEANRFEGALDRRERIGDAGTSRLARSRDHLLGPSPGWNQSYAHLDEPHVCFGGRLHSVPVKRDLAAATEREARRRHNHRHIGVSQGHRCSAGTRGP